VNVCADHPVYLVPTANDVSRLPPEFTRKGRIDEIFGVSRQNGEAWDTKATFEYDALGRRIGGSSTSTPALPAPSPRGTITTA